MGEIALTSFPQRFGPGQTMVAQGAIFVLCMLAMGNAEQWFPGFFGAAVVLEACFAWNWAILTLCCGAVGGSSSSTHAI